MFGKDSSIRAKCSGYSSDFSTCSADTDCEFIPILPSSVTISDTATCKNAIEIG